MTDRASRPLVGGRARAHSSAEVAKAEVRALAGRPLETVTPDRGKEFANHREVSRALGGVPFYFCQPHHPWQKPTVENTNGLIREFFPKGGGLLQGDRRRGAGGVREDQRQAQEGAGVQDGQRGLPGDVALSLTIRQPFWKWHGASFSLTPPPLRGTLYNVFATSRAGPVALSLMRAGCS